MLPNSGHGVINIMTFELFTKDLILSACWQFLIFFNITPGSYTFTFVFLIFFKRYIAGEFLIEFVFSLYDNPNIQILSELQYFRTNFKYLLTNKLDYSNSEFSDIFNFISMAFYIFFKNLYYILLVKLLNSLRRQMWHL